MLLGRAMTSTRPIRNPALFTILVGGGIAATLDIAYAICFALYRGATAERLLQSVASGLLGKDAFDGGPPAAALGLALHFSMAFLWAAGYYLASRRIPWLNRNAAIAGPLFGVFVFLTMNFIVLPLSNVPFSFKFTWLGTGTNFLSHLFFFGLPIALAARRAASTAR